MRFQEHCWMLETGVHNHDRGVVDLDACGGQKHKVAKALLVSPPRRPHVITTGFSKGLGELGETNRLFL
jgi:hypothetical protein